MRNFNKELKCSIKDADSDATYGPEGFEISFVNIDTTIRAESMRFSGVITLYHSSYGHERKDKLLQESWYWPSQSSFY